MIHRGDVPFVPCASRLFLAPALAFVVASGVPRLSWAANATSQCSSVPVPSGQVVVGAIHRNDCPSSKPNDLNAYLVKVPGVEESVCSVSPIPKGYVIKNQGSRTDCPQWQLNGVNARTIRNGAVPYDSQCSTTPVPSGMVVVAAGSRTDCPNWLPNPDVKNSYFIKKPGLEEQVCSVSTVPKGYVITSQGSASNCPNWLPLVPWLPGITPTTNSVRIKQPGGMESICSVSPLPEGYVIVQRGRRSDCPGAIPPGGFNTTTIKRPGAVETVCLESPVPPGYSIIGGARSSDCPNFIPIIPGTGGPGPANQKIIRR